MSMLAFILKTLRPASNVYTAHERASISVGERNFSMADVLEHSADVLLPCLLPQ